MPGAKARIRLDGADPINKDRLAFWPMTGPGGIVRDLMPTRTALIPGSLPDYAASRMGQVASFNGSSARLIGANALPSRADSGVFAWIRPNFSSASTTNRCIVMRSNAGGTTFGLRLLWVSGFGWYSDNVSGGVGGAYNSSATSFSAGEWHFLGFTYSAASGGQFWWDGMPVTTAMPFGGWASANLAGLSFYVGGNNGGTELFNGQIGPLSAFNRVPRRSEIWRMYQNPWAGTGRFSRPVPFVYPPLSATIDATIPITAQITAALQPFVDGGDTHDGLKRSRRLRRIETLRQRAEAERLADAQALRLALEAALGVAAELPADDAPRVAEAVQRAPKPAEVDWRRVADDAEQYARLSRLVSRLSAVVQAEAKRRADDDDDDDAAFLLGIA